MISWPLWYQAAATEARAIPRAVSPKAMVGWFLADPKELRMDDSNGDPFHFRKPNIWIHDEMDKQ